MDHTVCMVDKWFKIVISDLVAEPGPLLLLYRQTFRIPRQISQSVLTHTRQIFFSGISSGLLFLISEV